MIVKTGANYQNDGGYIEASREGESVVGKVDNKEFSVPDVNGLIDTVVPCQISKATSLASKSITINAVSKRDDRYITGFTVNESPRILGIMFNVGSVINLPPETPIKLGESSKDCAISIVDGNTVLKATGTNPIAILEAA